MVRSAWWMVGLTGLRVARACYVLCVSVIYGYVQELGIGRWPGFRAVRGLFRFRSEAERQLYTLCSYKIQVHGYLAPGHRLLAATGCAVPKCSRHPKKTSTLTCNWPTITGSPIELAAFLFSILDSKCWLGAFNVCFGLVLLFFPSFFFLVALSSTGRLIV
jgi:hypothetical protein